jgi:hypothetical protein
MRRILVAAVVLLSIDANLISPLFAVEDPTPKSVLVDRIPKGSSSGLLGSSFLKGPEKHAALPAEILGSLPLCFVENQGQLEESVAFYAQGLDKSLYFTAEGFTIALMEREGESRKRWAV